MPSAYKHKRIFTLLNSLKANIRMHGVTTKICIYISSKWKRKWRVQINSQQGPWCMLQRKIFINPHYTTPIWIVKWKNVPAWEFKQRTLTIVKSKQESFLLIIFRIFGYGRELCCTLEFIQTLYVQNDKEKVVNFYNLVFPGEAKMGLGFISFRAPSIH